MVGQFPASRRSGAKPRLPILRKIFTVAFKCSRADRGEKEQEGGKKVRGVFTGNREGLLFNKNAGILGTAGNSRVTGDGCIPSNRLSFVERTDVTFLAPFVSREARFLAKLICSV